MPARVLLLAALLAPTAIAQFFNLAASADGSQVFFSTPLTQRLTTQPAYGKLFAVDAGGLHLQESRPTIVPPKPASDTQPAQTNAFNILGATESADGSVVAVIAESQCAFGPCNYLRLEDYHTTVTDHATGHGNQREYLGALRLSANGEWGFGGSSFGYFIHPAYLYHLTTGEAVPVPVYTGSSDLTVNIAVTGRPVADDGTFAYSAPVGVVIVRRGIATRIPSGADGYNAPVLDRTGATMVFAACHPSPDGRTCAYSIRLADIANSTSTLLISDAYAPSLSDDGRTLLYLSTRTGAPQPRIFRFHGFTDAPLATDPAGISQAVLSGDGSAAYLATLGARLLKVSVATGAVEELIPRTPFLTAPASSLAPGKQITLPGTGLADSSATTAPPLPTSLNGVAVDIQGLTARIQAVTPQSITLLVPPNVIPAADTTIASPIALHSNSNSPFDDPTLLAPIVPSAPEFLQAAHQDWSAIVTPGNPARLGEIVHLYAAGLGDTLPAVPFGDPAPAAEPLARLSVPLTCTAPPSTAPLDLLFQGLAPHLAGIYQIDLRIPATAAGTNLFVQCSRGATVIPVLPSI